jgi:acyl-CoA thioesterase
LTSFQEVIAGLAETDGAYVIDASEEWAQGRTLFGGMTGALVHGAATRAFPDLPPLRSMQVMFVGPATGRLSIRPALLRRGRSTALISADCWSEEGLAARATFAFGAPRESEVTHDLVRRFDVAAAEECEPFHRSSKPLRGYLAKFELRLAAGSRLFQPDRRPEFAIWVRFRDGGGDDPVTSLIALADALPCAALVNFPRLAPVSTVSWTVDLHRQPASGSDWYLIWSESEHASEGYSMQDTRIYAASGEPLASARQVVAIFI